MWSKADIDSMNAALLSHSSLFFRDTKDIVVMSLIFGVGISHVM